MSKTKTITGKNEADLNEKQWEWQTTASPPVVITKQWPDEILPLDLQPSGSHTKIEARDQVSRRIDYDD